MLLKRNFIKKIEEKLGFRKSNSDEFESLKSEVIRILKKQAEKEHSEVKKSLRKMDNSYTYLEKSLEGKIIQKAGYPVGTIREWKGKKYIKIAPKMWKRKYDKNDRGASISAGKLIKLVEKCENPEQLMKLVLSNKQRFSDENGIPLPIVDKIRAAVDKKNESFDKQTQTPKKTPKKGEMSEKTLNSRKEAYKEWTEEQLQNAINDRKQSLKTVDSTQKKKINNTIKVMESVLNDKKNESFDKQTKTTKKNNPFDMRRGGYSITVKNGINEYKKQKQILKWDLEKKKRKIENEYDLSDMTEEKKNLFLKPKFENLENKFNAAKENVEYIKNRLRILADKDGVNNIIKKMKTAGIYDEVMEETEKHANRSKGMKGNSSNDISKEEIKDSDSQSKKPTSLSDVRKKYESSKSVQGNKKTVTLPNGEKIKCHYKLVEADAPTATHDEKTFAPVEALTKNGQTINDRDYAHDRDAQESVISIAQKYGGQALSNPPIVTKDGVVVSGNNRTMSSKLAAKNGTDKAYLDDLKEQIDEFGIDEDELKNFKHPRIILEMDNEHEHEYTTQEMAKFNESGMKTQNITEKAVKMAKTLSNESISDIADSISGFDTLGELYNDEDAVNDFVRKLIKNGILTNQNKAEYVTDGKLSDAGKEFVETVLCGTILNESNIRQMNSEGGRNIRKKLIRALMPLAQNKGNGKEYSINDELNRAVEIALRVAKNHKETPDVNSYMQQQDMFDTEKPSELTVKFAEFVHDLGEKNFADKMKSLQAGLRESANGSQDIFLGGCETKDEVINRIFELKKSIQRVLTSLFSVIN